MHFRLLRTANFPVSQIHNFNLIGAGDETRTRDPQLGRLMLYQLSYARITGVKSEESGVRSCMTGSPAHSSPILPNSRGGGRIRTYSVRDNRFTVCPGSPTPAHPLDFSALRKGPQSYNAAWISEEMPKKFLFPQASAAQPLEPAEGLEPPTS